MKKPARKIRPQKNLHSYRGKRSSQLNRNSIRWESLLEKDYIKILEFDPCVISYESQPIQIKYHFEGKERHYFPDFKVITDTYETYLIEVKPYKEVNKKENVVKFAAARLYCKQQNWKFEVFSEQQIRQGFLLDNIGKLRKYKFEYTDPMSIKNLETLLKVKLPCKIKELKKIAVVDMSSSKFYLNLYYLISKHRVKVDLINQSLNDECLLG